MASKTAPFGRGEGHTESETGAARKVISVSVGSDQPSLPSSSLNLSPWKFAAGIELVEAADSACYVLDKVYPLSYQHGQDRLG